MTLRCITWFGGKGKMLSKLLHIVPYDHIYVEPFGGGASVLLNRRPSPVEVYNDIDSRLFNFFVVLSDPDLFEQFKRRVEALPYSRELYNRERQKDLTSGVEGAVAFFVHQRQSFGGRSGWGYQIDKTSRSMAGIVACWLTAIELLPEIHSRLKRVQIEHIDGIECIRKYDTLKTVFYIDPPYHEETRSDVKYLEEFTDDQHKQLTELLCKVKGSVVFSCYDHETYESLLSHGYTKQAWTTVNHIGAPDKRQKRVEVVYKRLRKGQMELF